MKQLEYQSCSSPLAFHKYFYINFDWSRSSLIQRCARLIVHSFCKGLKISTSLMLEVMRDILQSRYLRGNVKVKESLCLRARRPIRPTLISGFISTKRLGVFLLPPGWDASLSQGYPQHFASTHLYSWVERGTVRVKCLAQEHNTMSPARTRTRTTRSGVEHSNLEATAPPTQ